MLVETPAGKKLFAFEEFMEIHYIVMDKEVIFKNLLSKCCHSLKDECYCYDL